MHNPVAISLLNVSKTYHLYGSRREQVLDVLGLSKLAFWDRRGATDYQALQNISLEVKRGERLGIVGRNGAGKTTLLKLMTGNFAATSGVVQVNGKVQALMTVGLGFYPEFTGTDNIRYSLAYNGLSRKELEDAIEDVVEFVELGEFLHQPMKTYSMGMQARLMFATATAIKPDILIVDEVLGAGDAYFSAKSAHRMEKLALSGCTLLLVSHSTPQTLQFCNRAIWLEKGEIVLEGHPLQVVKSYEEFNQRLSCESEQVHHAQGAQTVRLNAAGKARLLEERKWLQRRVLEQVLAGIGQQDQAQETTVGPVSIGGISRWGGGERGLKIERVRLLDGAGMEKRQFRTGQPMDIEVQIVAEAAGNYPCYFCILMFSEGGQWLARDCSERFDFSLPAGGTRRVRLHFDRLLLGNGQYVFSVAIYNSLDLQHLESARFYDLLSRSFQFKVTNEYPDDESVFKLPSAWIEAEEVSSSEASRPL